MALNFIVLRFPIVMVAAVAAACDNEKPRWHRNKRLALLQSVIGGFIENIRRRIPCGYFSLVGQSFSALGASSLQDISAVSGFHSLSEAVLLFSLTLFRLISSQHANCTSLLALSSASIYMRIFRKRVSPLACGYAFTQ
jgi:hypothetical protein